MQTINTTINGKKDPAPMKGGLDSVAGTISVLSPAEQLDLKSDQPSPAAAPVPDMSKADLIKLLNRLSDKLDSVEREKAALIKEANKPGFYTHIVGRNGVPATKDQSIKLFKLADGRYKATLDFYMNGSPQSRIQKSNLPDIDPDTKKQRRNPDGSLKFREFENLDLATTRVSESLTTFTLDNGEVVTLQGFGTISVGRYTESEVVTRESTAESVAGLLNAQKARDLSNPNDPLSDSAVISAQRKAEEAAASGHPVPFTTPTDTL